MREREGEKDHAREQEEKRARRFVNKNFGKPQGRRSLQGITRQISHLRQASAVSPQALIICDELCNLKYG
jgi:hypothetical protein